MDREIRTTGENAGVAGMIHRVTIEVGDMTIIIYPESGEVDILYRGGFPSSRMSLKQFTELVRKEREKREE
jgi:hypothetical protein